MECNIWDRMSKGTAKESSFVQSPMTQCLPVAHQKNACIAMGVLDIFLIFTVTQATKIINVPMIVTHFLSLYEVWLNAQVENQWGWNRVFNVCSDCLHISHFLFHMVSCDGCMVHYLFAHLILLVECSNSGIDLLFHKLLVMFNMITEN